jgi:predicted nucleic acid-binding protein
LPETIRLDPKDQPILLAAIHEKADYLLTGDARHFVHLYGKRIEGVLVLRPAQYLERRRRRSKRRFRPALSAILMTDKFCYQS